MKKLQIPTLPKWVFLIIGLLLGALIILAIRYFTYSPEHVHYHANFSVYLNGQREEFKDPKYYQEVAICSASTGITTPQQRTHMHDEENTVVHVHDHAVTWGQFFENLGWSIGPDYIITDTGQRYFADGDSKLHVVINNQDYTDLTSVAGMVIKDQSKLLLSFGDINEATLQKEYKAIPSSAKHFNNSKDPASCSSGEAPTRSERLKHLF
jgi:hypothetical protein